MLEPAWSEAVTVPSAASVDPLPDSFHLIAFILPPVHFDLPRGFSNVTPAEELWIRKAREKTTNVERKLVACIIVMVCSVGEGRSRRVA